jgi:hypothetical protein
MTGAVVPFPLARRRAYILKQAAWFAERPPQAAETNLQRQIQVQREAMQRRGLDPDVIAQQCREMEYAVRVAALRFGGSASG